MPSVFCDLYATLYAPLRFYHEAIGEWFNSYIATYALNGCTFCFSIAQAVKDEFSPLLPAGTIAHVVANLGVSENSIFLLASSMPGLRAIPGGMTPNMLIEACRPVLSFIGTVSRGSRVDPQRPAAIIVEVTAECKGSWPGQPTVIRCYLNREIRRFRSYTPLRVGDAVDITGKLTSWEDGMLVVDVCEARMNFAGEVPDEPLVTLPNPFAGVPVYKNFAVFREVARRFEPAQANVNTRPLSTPIAVASGASGSTAGPSTRSGTGPTHGRATRADVENVNPVAAPGAVDVNGARVVPGVAV